MEWAKTGEIMLHLAEAPGKRKKKKITTPLA